MSRGSVLVVFFFFNDTAPTEIYTLPLHDALPISPAALTSAAQSSYKEMETASDYARRHSRRSEEHTSELQSQSNLVCRLLLEKKKQPLHAWYAQHRTFRARPPPSYRSTYELLTSL